MSKKIKYFVYLERFLLPILCSSIVSVVLFHTVVTGEATLVGNADRLNHMMAFSRYHSQNIRNHNFVFWDELMLGGIDSISLNFNIWSFLYSFVPQKYFMSITEFSAILQLFIAGVLAYFSLRKFGISCVSALCSAICFQCSSLALLQVTQHDFTFLVLLLSPLAWSNIHELKPGNLIRSFIFLTIILVVIALFGFLQSAAYLMFFVSIYGCWRSYITRNFGPFTAVLMAEIISVAMVMPRLLASLDDSKQLKRSHNFSGHNFVEIYDFQNIRFWEILRFFSNKIFGGFPSEAAQLGNNINLTEGMLLNSSVIATVLVIASIFFLLINRYDAKTLVKTDAPIMAFFVIFSILAVICWPVSWFLFNIFFQQDFTHSRIIVAACFPLVLLIGTILDNLNFKTNFDIDARIKRLTYTFCIIGIISGFAIPIVCQMIGDKFKFFQISVNGRNLSPPILEPSSIPVSLVAQRLAPDTIELSWNFYGKANGYNVTKYSDGEITPVNFISYPGSVVRLSNLSYEKNYIFSVQACSPNKCYNGLSVEVPAYTHNQPNRYYGSNLNTLTIDPNFAPPNDHTMYLKSSVIAETIILALVALAIIVYCFYYPESVLSKPFLYSLIGLAISNTIYNGERALNGPHLFWKTGKPAFNLGDSMLAHPDDFKQPNLDILSSINHKLKNNNYRSVFLCNPSEFNTFCASHMAHFWNLRSLDGYGPGVPTGIAAFPWPKDTLSMRALTFSAQLEALPWKLLAINNVKFAILVTPDIYRNRHEDNDINRAIEPKDFKIFENPLKVTPRVFLVAEAKPAKDAKEAVNSLLGSVNIDPEALSYVVGMSGEEKFDVSGDLREVFDGDKISIEISPSTKSRLLILNENWHPAWIAESNGVNVPVMQANGSMRALILKPNTSLVTLRYVPVYASILSSVIFIFSIIIFVFSVAFLKNRTKKIPNF